MSPVDDPKSGEIMTAPSNIGQGLNTLIGSFRSQYRSSSINFEHKKWHGNDHAIFQESRMNLKRLRPHLMLSEPGIAYRT